MPCKRLDLLMARMTESEMAVPPPLGDVKTAPSINTFKAKYIATDIKCVFITLSAVLHSLHKSGCYRQLLLYFDLSFCLKTRSTLNRINWKRRNLKTPSMKYFQSTLVRINLKTHLFWSEKDKMRFQISALQSVFEKFRFQNIFRPHTKPEFSN